MYSISFPVRYYEADPMGVVHHSEYLRYFELARNRWLNDVGYTNDVCNEKHIVFPVLHVEIDYRRSARFGGFVTATAKVAGFSGARVTFQHQLLDEQGRTCAEGKVTVGFLNTLSNFVMRCPEDLAIILNNELNTI